MFDNLRMDGLTAAFLAINIIGLYLEVLKGEKLRTVWVWAAALNLATMAWSYEARAYALVMLSGCRVIVSYRNHKLWQRDSEGLLSDSNATLKQELEEERDMSRDLMKRVNDATDDRHERRALLRAHETRCRDNDVPCDDLVTRAGYLEGSPK